MELIFDDREHKLWQIAKDICDSASRAHLTTGDILIGRRTVEGILIPYVIVERKTWADLAASMKDGRKTNIEKLKEYRTETGARIAYLLEGVIPSSIPDVCGIPYRNLRAHLDHLLFRDGIIELNSDSPRDSLKRLIEFANNLKTISFEINGQMKDGLEVATRKRPPTDEQILDKIWSSFGGISLASARAFRVFRVSQVFNGLSIAELSVVRVGSRKFGSERAAKLIASLNQRAIFEKVLCAVPQISSKRAAVIIEEIGEANKFFQNWNDTYAVLKDKLPKSCLSSLEKYLFEKSG